MFLALNLVLNAALCILRTLVSLYNEIFFKILNGTFCFEMFKVQQTTYKKLQDTIRVQFLPKIT